MEKDNNTGKYEVCVACGKVTEVLIATHIVYRTGYVEGAGQMCRDCAEKYDVC